MLVYLAFVTVLLAALWGSYFLWRRRIRAELAEGGAAEYARIKGLDEAAPRARAEAARLDAAGEGLAEDDPHRAALLSEREAFERSALGRAAGHSPLLGEMDEAAFVRVYERVQAPRFPAYALGALTAFLVGTPLLLGAMTAVHYYAERFGMIAQPAEAASQLYFSDGGVATVAQQVSPEALSYILQGWFGFYYYLGLLAFWVIVVWAAMTLYHRRTPGLLREEVLRSR